MSFILSEQAMGDRARLLSLEGDTTAAAGDNLRRHLAGARREDKRVIVDLERVSFLDSAVVAAIVAACHDCADGPRIVVVEPVDAMIARALEIDRVDLFADVVATLREALERVGVAPDSVPSPPRPLEPSPRRASSAEIEVAQLRRFAQELRSEPGMADLELGPDEMERRQAAETDLLRARESEQPPPPPGRTAQPE
jgi:anti-anti-sigma factor